MPLADRALRAIIAVLAAEFVAMVLIASSHAQTEKSPAPKTGIICIPVGKMLDQMKGYGFDGYGVAPGVTTITNPVLIRKLIAAADAMADDTERGWDKDADRIDVVMLDQAPHNYLVFSTKGCAFDADRFATATLKALIAHALDPGI